ncbi:MAG TPA: hypothetical protein VN963_08365 [bacterium]|nr:hypothetical protein [bacterium]
MPWACTNSQPTGPLATYNLTATFTNTFTFTPTNWAGYTSTPTPLYSATFTSTATNTPTSTSTNTATNTPGAGTHTATPTLTPTTTNTATSTITLTPTATFSQPTPVVASTPWSTGNNLPPNGLAYDGTNVYVAEGLDGYPGGQIQTFTASTGTSINSYTTIGAYTFGQPNGVAYSNFNQNIYVVDQFNNAVYEISPAGPSLVGSGPLTTWTSTGAPAPGAFLGPEGIAVDGSGNVYVADTGNDYVEEFNPSLSPTTPVAEFGGSGSGNGKFNNPSAVAVDGSGNIYVVDASNQLVQIFTSGHTFSSQFSTGSNSDIYGIILDGSGNIYLADSGLDPGIGQVEEYGSLTGSSPGALLTQGLSGNSSPSPDPVGLTFIGSNLLVADYSNNQLYLVTP